MNSPQQKIQSLLNKLVQDGRERGVQVAAYLDGELVVDAWAGIADVESGRPVDGETLFPIFSTGKGIVATIIHILVERGKLAYETRIADVWPEFGAHGKENITVNQALWHTSALPYMPDGLAPSDLCDWEAMCAAIAGLKPAWEPGTRSEYHAVTYGWIVGEVARRVDGRPLQQLIREEICEPLGMSNLFIGIPDEAEPRVAILEEIFDSPEAQIPPPPSAGPQAISPWMWPLHAWMNQPEARRACIPGSNAIATARSVARHYAALLPCGVDGVELLPPERVRLATQFQGTKFPERVGGYHFFGEYSDTRLSTFGHGGYGGSTGFADRQYRLAVALTKNLYSKQGAQDLIVTELREALGAPL